jgi:hypothetical protein
MSSAVWGLAGFREEAFFFDFAFLSAFIHRRIVAGETILTSSPRQAPMPSRLMAL